MHLFVGDRILHRKDSSGTKRKSFALLNNFSEIAEYKISIPKSIAFLYNTKQLSKKGIRKKNYPIYKFLKSPKINSTREIKGLYNVNNKILKEKQNKQTNKHTRR